MGSSLCTSAVFIATVLCGQPALSTTPIPPYTNDDLVAFGDRPEFGGAQKLEKPGHNCSSMAVDLGRAADGEAGQVFFTAAHCFFSDGDLSKPIDFSLASVGGHNVTSFVIHPSYLLGGAGEDLAAFTIPASGTHKGYAIFSGDPSSLVGKTLYHVGFGDMTDGSSPRQAMAVRISEFDDQQFKAFYEENQQASSDLVSGRVSNGDSGGGLFYRNELGSLEFVGAMKTHWDTVDVWSYVSPDFVKLVKAVFQQGKSGDLQQEATKIFTQLYPGRMEQDFQTLISKGGYEISDAEKGQGLAFLEAHPHLQVALNVRVLDFINEASAFWQLNFILEGLPHTFKKALDLRVALNNKILDMLNAIEYSFQIKLFEEDFKEKLQQDPGLRAALDAKINALGLQQKNDL